MEFDELSKRVIGCAIEVHRELGPGLLESTYEQCLAHELKLNGIAFRLQHPQPVEYKGIHEAQLLTYMKPAGVKTGLLINFNVTRLKTGIKRFVL
jgi:hypothetical protein